MLLQRQTVISKNLIEMLQKANSPLSMLQIQDLFLKKSLNPNKSTLYRILEKLLQKKLINSINLENGKSYFEWKHNKHHHHFFCKECETVTCLDNCLIHQNHIDLNTLVPNQNFTVAHHDFNLYGYCEKCTIKSSN